MTSRRPVTATHPRHPLRPPAPPRAPAAPHRAGLRWWVTASIWLAVVGFAIAALAIGFFLYRGDPEGAARIANREIETELAPNEAVEERVLVRRRYWWDYFRLTHGVLAATNRRLIYLGVPPEPLLRREEGPREIDFLEFVYSTRLTATPTRPALGMREGIALGEAGTGARVEERFGVAAPDHDRLARTLGVMRREVERLRAAADAERRATEATVAAARRAIYHLVQRGEALTSVGQRYGVPVESLIAWNGLAGSRITVGQRLLVKPETK